MPLDPDRSARPQDRYARQALFHELGGQAQARIGRGTAVVAGVGALGCQEATLLARAGVGRLVLIDRDLVEWTNLQRQVLFDEHDAKEALPKAEAARAHLQRVNSEIEIVAHASDLAPGNADRLLSGADVILDGMDNFEARYLLNDWAVKHGVPWIYAAAVGASGLTMPVVPGTTPCLRCLFPEPPPSGASPTCDTAGVLGPITSIVGSLAALEALKVLAGRPDALRKGLLQLDLWSNDLRPLAVDAPLPGCPCCDRREFPFLEVKDAAAQTALCGRDAVQVSPAPATRFDFDAVRRTLAQALALDDKRFLLRFEVEGLGVTLFRDGRAIVQGTTDPSRARAIYARYVGN